MFTESEHEILVFSGLLSKHLFMGAVWEGVTEAAPLLRCHLVAINISGCSSGVVGTQGSARAEDLLQLWCLLWTVPLS